MVRYYALIGLATTVGAALLIQYIKKRYIDVPVTRCPICGNTYESRSCPMRGSR